MTEYEKYCSAKRAVDSLANGLNPFDGTPLPEDTILNNVYVARALFIASDALRQVIEKEKKGQKKEDFSVEDCDLESFVYSATPIPITEITKRINATIRNENSKQITYKKIIDWLLEKEILHIVEYNIGSSYKEPTESGRALGISTEWRQKTKGEYQVTLYNTQAQHFIIDNLSQIIEKTNSEKK